MLLASVNTSFNSFRRMYDEEKSTERELKIPRLAKVQACGLVFRTYCEVSYQVHIGAVEYSDQRVLQ